MAEREPFDAASGARSAEAGAILTEGISKSQHDSLARTEHVKRLNFVLYLGTERHLRNPWRSAAISGTGNLAPQTMFLKAGISDRTSLAGPKPVPDQLRRSVDSSPMRFMSNGVVR